MSWALLAGGRFPSPSCLQLCELSAFSSGLTVYSCCVPACSLSLLLYILMFMGIDTYILAQQRVCYRRAPNCSLHPRCGSIFSTSCFSVCPVLTALKPADVSVECVSKEGIPRKKSFTISKVPPLRIMIKTKLKPWGPLTPAQPSGMGG